MSSPSAAQPVSNVLFVMCDQLRWDYLSCFGHPELHTPHIDALAARGVRFERAFVQSAVCVPSRMSFYTGRYVSSHGTTWNYVPLSVAQVTLGEHLARAGRAATLAGKTHVIPDRAGLARLGIQPDSNPGQLLLAGGFHQLDRYDGHAPPGAESGYADYLRAQGYDGADPWNEHVVAAIDARGERVSGWHCRHAHLPARVREEHSETAYMTDRAIDFMREQADTPWVLHLSYIKPHWPLMAPAPYHAMYRGRDTAPVLRGDPRTENAHPVVEAYRTAHEDCISHQSDAFVRHVRPTYMGLVKQVDDHLGRLFAAMGRMGRLDDTLVVFTSDHGDHLGDHGLGEKELFYEQAVRVPMIVVDPRAAADATRGTVDRRMVEAVDVLPTILDALGLDPAPHLVEGRSLLPLLHGAPPAGWRDCVFSELDYAFRGARTHLGRRPDECQAFMARTERWKYVLHQGLRPQLFDLQEDPHELVDLGDAPGHEAVRREMKDRITDWLLRLKRRTNVSHDYIESHTEYHRQIGVLIGVW